MHLIFFSYSDKRHPKLSESACLNEKVEIWNYYGEVCNYFFFNRKPIHVELLLSIAIWIWATNSSLILINSLYLIRLFFSYIWIYNRFKCVYSIQFYLYLVRNSISDCYNELLLFLELKTWWSFLFMPIHRFLLDHFMKLCFQFIHLTRNTWKHTSISSQMLSRHQLCTNR